MSSSTTDQVATANNVRIDDDELIVELTDGRTIGVPISWFPRLLYGSTAERSNWRLIGAGRGIHWPELDEDISVENLLSGRSSGESQTSLRKWLETRSRERQQ